MLGFRYHPLSLPQYGLSPVGTDRPRGTCPVAKQRASYRHPLAPSDRIAVEIERLPQRTRILGEVVNLSLGGMLVRVATPDVPLLERDRLLVRFSLPNISPRFEIVAEISYCRAEGDGSHLGVRFHPLIVRIAQAEREGLLLRFLNDQQEKARKAKKSQAAGSAKF